MSNVVLASLVINALTITLMIACAPTRHRYYGSRRAPLRHRIRRMFAIRYQIQRRQCARRLVRAGLARDMAQAHRIIATALKRQTGVPDWAKA